MKPRWHQNSDAFDPVKESYGYNCSTRDLQRAEEIVVDVIPGVTPPYRFVNHRSGVEVEVRTSRPYWAMIEVRGFGKPKDPMEYDFHGEHLGGDDVDVWAYGPYQARDWYHYCWESHTYFGGLRDERYYRPHVKYWQPTLPGFDDEGRGGYSL